MSLLPTIALHEISGISRFNARRIPPRAEESAELAASLVERGVTTPILLRMEEGRRVALDGGRRFLALRGLAERGEIADDFPVPYAMFEGSDEEAAEVSLISFVQRADLHAVDEFERFDELRRAFGLDESEIARKTGKSLRFVKERLRLARLAARIRDAWRAGALLAEQAKAFAASESHADQERVLDALTEEFGGDLRAAALDPRRILRELSGDAVRDTDSLARFVGAADYVAAGGELDEQLFPGESWYLNGALLRRLAQEKLERLGAEIVAAEGWGWACYEHKDAHRWRDCETCLDASEGDYTEAENARLDEIDALPQAERETLYDEVAAIEARALLRATPADERAGQGVYLTLDAKGRLDVTRGLVHEEESAGPSGSAGEEEIEEETPAESRPRSPRSASAGEEEAAPAPSGPTQHEMRANARAVLDAAGDAALAEVVSRNVTLAMIVAVARLGCAYGGQIIDVSRGYGRNANARGALLRELSGLGFEEALHRARAAHEEDASALPVAFAELIAGFITIEKDAGFSAPRALLTVAASLSDIEGALDRTLDREAYFKAETKETAVEAIRAMEGDAAANEASRLKKADLARRAALLAADRHFLPEPLRSAVDARPKDLRSTARAMLEAIEADEAEPEKEAQEDEQEDEKEEDARRADVAETEEGAAPEAIVAIDYSAPLFARFLREHIRWDEELSIKGAQLREAYLDKARPSRALNAGEIGALLKKIGVAKEKRGGELYYLGLDLRDGGAEARQAAE